VVLTDIYAAGEDPIDGVSLAALAPSVERGAGCPVHVVPRLDDLPQVLADIAQPGDMVITLGAGSIGSVPDRLLRLLRASGRQSEPGGRP